MPFPALQRLRLPGLSAWALALTVLLAAGPAAARSIVTDDTGGVGGSGSWQPPALPSCGIHGDWSRIFKSPGELPIDCLDFTGTAGLALPSLSGAGQVVQYMHNIKQINLGVHPGNLNGTTPNPLFAEPDYREPNRMASDTNLGNGSDNAVFDLVFDSQTHIGTITLKQAIDHELMVVLGGLLNPSLFTGAPSSFVAPTHYLAPFFFSSLLPSGRAAGTVLNFDLSGVAGFLPSLNEVRLYWVVPTPGSAALALVALVALAALAAAAAPRPSKRLTA